MDAKRKPPDEPEIRVYGRRITESDVRAMLRSYGDVELERFESGELPRAEAFEMARCYVRNLIEASAETVAGDPEELSTHLGPEERGSPSHVHRPANRRPPVLRGV